jgi:hypothetical protein
MHRRMISILSVLAILLMALSPLYEFFDHWDNIPKTGNDTATTLVAIGVSIGLWLISVLVVIELGAILFSLLTSIFDKRDCTEHLFAYGTDFERLLFSPPPIPLSLRI